MQNQLKEAEQEYQDFRLKHPQLFVKGADFQSRITSMEKQRSEVRLKRVELETKLAFLKTALAPGTDPEGMERAARIALLKLQLRGVDIVNMRKSVAADGKDGSAVEFARLYSDAIQSEIEEVRAWLKALDDLFEGEMKTARELSNYEAQEERLRTKIMANRTLFDAIVRRIKELNPRKDQFLK